LGGVPFLPLAGKCNLCVQAPVPKALPLTLAEKTRPLHAGACRSARSLDREGEPVQGEQAPCPTRCFCLTIFAFIVVFQLWITLWITCG